MSENPGAEFFSSDYPDAPEDPISVAYEDFQESEDWSRALQAVARVKVDDVDAGPFTTRDILLDEVVGADAAIDVAAEGLLIGFEAGFRYGNRGALGAFRKRLIENQIERYGIVLPDVQEIVDALGAES